MDSEKSAEYLCKIGKFLSGSCPAASRFYMSNFEKYLSDCPHLLKNQAKKGSSYCHHCGTIWASDNFKIRVVSRRRRFGSTKKIVYRCNVCRKTTAFPVSISGKKSQTKMSTPRSAIKIKKIDLNAGLFIPSPCNNSSSERNILEDTESQLSESVTENGNKSLASSNSLNISNSVEENNSIKKVATPENTMVSITNSQQQSTSKKKKTLLAQILDQEDKKKKKTSLSSFLVSL